MVPIEDSFEQIDATADKLVEINRREADRALADVYTQQRRSLGILGGTALGGSALALLAAIWVTGVIRRRDEEIAHGSELLETRVRELDAFAGRVAHDLRGPLTTISLAAARLAQSTPQEAGTSDVLRRGVTRMETLIEDLLTLSRIGAEPSGATAEVEAVAAAVEDEIARLVAPIQGTMRVDVEPASVRCGDGLLRQVLWNLCENAVKYRRPEVPVEIDVRGRVSGRRYELRVSDNASGMSGDDVRQAFEPFYRGDGVRAIPGTGLGLSIVRRVIEASGGTIAIESSVGKGTTFVMRVPLAEDHHHPTPDGRHDHRAP
jgi:signal transduction histidine kinase